MGRVEDVCRGRVVNRQPPPARVCAAVVAALAHCVCEQVALDDVAAAEAVVEVDPRSWPEIEAGRGPGSAGGGWRVCASQQTTRSGCRCTLSAHLCSSLLVSTQLCTISLHISARPCSSRLISRPVKVDVAAQGRLRGDRLVEPGISRDVTAWWSQAATAACTRLAESAAEISREICRLEPHRRLLLPDANLADQIMRDRRVARLLAASPVGPHRVRKPDAAVAVEAPAGPTPCRKGAGAHPRGLVRRDGRVAVVAREEDACPPGESRQRRGSQPRCGTRLGHVSENLGHVSDTSRTCLGHVSQPMWEGRGARAATPLPSRRVKWHCATVAPSVPSRKMAPDRSGV